MNFARPSACVSPTLDGDVLVVLAGTTRSLTGREVARLSRRGSQRGVLSALERLVAQGLVNREEAGSALLYTLNREHVAAPAADALSQLRDEFFSRIRTEASAWKHPPVHLSVFGSTARSDGDEASDVDVFVVRPDRLRAEDVVWRDQIDRLANRIERWSGNHAGIAEVSQHDVRRLRREQPDVVGELLSDAITLVGPEVATVLRPAKP